MKRTILQSFEWWTDQNPHLWVRLSERAKELKDAGFTDIWLPPCYKGQAGSDDVGYGVYDMYDLGEFDAKGSVATKYGTRAELLELADTLHKNDLNILIDVVFNHRMGADGYEKVMAREINPSLRDETTTDAEEIEAPTVFTFPQRGGKYSDFTWNHECFDGCDYDNSKAHQGIFLFDGKSWDDEVDDENENYDYLMGADLDFSNDAVREECMHWGRWMQDTLHNDGWRLDAIKHINARFYEDWITNMRDYHKGDMFAVGEYWNGDLNKLHRYIDETHATISMFDVPLHFHLLEASDSLGGYDMRGIFNDTLTSLRPDLSVTFVDNHDTQPGEGLSSFVEDWFKPQAYALILLREEGTPCVFAGDYDGIPHNDVPAKKDIIDKLLKVRQKMSGTRRDYFDHEDIVGWTYEGEGQDGFAVLLTNRTGGTKHMSLGAFYAGVTLSDGEHTVTLDAEGAGDFTVNDGALAVYEVQ